MDASPDQLRLSINEGSIRNGSRSVTTSELSARREIGLRHATRSHNAVCRDQDPPRRTVPHCEPFRGICAMAPAYYACPLLTDLQNIQRLQPDGHRSAIECGSCEWLVGPSHAKLNLTAEVFN